MTNISLQEQVETKNKTAKPLLYIGITSMCMVFGGLTSAYVVRSGDPGWLHFDLPVIFYISSALIVASSITLFVAQAAAKKDNYSQVKMFLLTTLALGIGFVISQFMAWKELVAQGIVLAGVKSNPAGSFIYVISGVHLIHLLVGILVLMYAYYKSTQQTYHSKNLLGLQLCSIYWHFLDILWIYLFVFFIIYH